MKLQIAIDTGGGREALEIVDAVYDIIDIVEVGTPLILREGLAPVALIKKKYPRVSVLADTKIVDGGGVECADACNAGADIVTVLALSCEATIRAVVAAAHKMDRKVLADLISVDDIPRRSKLMEKWEVDYIAVHTPVDAQQGGRTPLGDLKQLSGAISSQKAAVAGGVNASSVKDYAALHPAIIIAGASLVKAPDIRRAVLEMKSLINEAANQ
ncbi:MAG: orotidine 5'-phosphate decarboxylase [Treponema sp.]|jgi:3-hexulose-6-phosphate synthase|nr:orotidine 5'-phosphate decarboxylase [Treponema sp.]